MPRGRWRAPSILIRPQPGRRGDLGSSGEGAGGRGRGRTLGAPYDPAHVAAPIRSASRGDRARGRSRGPARSDGPFRIRKQFLDDIAGPTAGRGSLRCARGFWSPRAARCDRRGSTFCRADLSMRRKTPQELRVAGRRRTPAVAPGRRGLCADVLAAWVTRYLEARPTGSGGATAPSKGAVRGKRKQETARFSRRCRLAAARILADEPEEGRWEVPAAAPLTCCWRGWGPVRPLTLRMYRRSQGLAVETGFGDPEPTIASMRRTARTARPGTRRIDRIRRRISISGNPGRGSARRLWKSPTKNARCTGPSVRGSDRDRGRGPQEAGPRAGESEFGRFRSNRRRSLLCPV